jgi:hypothetical protein
MILEDTTTNTAVSLTPLALDRDGCAFRIAQSFAELPIRSRRRRCGGTVGR